MNIHRHYFSTFGPALTCLVLSAIGAAITYASQYFLETSVWYTWLPLIFFTIPFIFYCIVLPIAIISKAALNGEYSNDRPNS